MNYLNGTFTGYATEAKIEFSGAFETLVQIPGQEDGVWAHFLIAPKGQLNLLSKSTAFALGVLKIGYNVSLPFVGLIQKVPEFPKVDGFQVKIHIDSSVTPVIQPCRRCPLALEAEVETEIRNMLDKGIIEPVEGPPVWVSPIVPVKKSNGKLRICVDMRVANTAVRTEQYQLPDATITAIPSVAKVSKLDLSQAYFHFELDEQSRDITTFTSQSGIYRFKRLMFGLKSAPEVFQRSMDVLFRGIDYIIIYMDDILVYGRTEKEHDETLEQVLKKIDELKMEINVEKSVLNATEVTFLGFVVSKDGIRTTNERIQAIMDLKAPKNVSELRSLIGMYSIINKKKLFKSFY